MGLVTSKQLVAICPRCPADKIDAYARGLTAACIEAQINTLTRAAAFIGQLAHESGELRWFEEQDDGHRYEGRRDLGNTQAGDGPRYKGRGPIQLTGRSNYLAAGAALGIDLVGFPEKAAEAEVGFRTAAWYWTTRKINTLADALDFVAITRAINGGTNGLEQRLNYYRHALEVLGRDVVIFQPPTA